MITHEIFKTPVGEFIFKSTNDTHNIACLIDNEYLKTKGIDYFIEHIAFNTTILERQKEYDTKTKETTP